MPEHHWTKQNRIGVVEYSSFEVSDPSEVPRIVGKLIFLVFSGSQADLRALDWAQ